MPKRLHFDDEVSREVDRLLSTCFWDDAWICKHIINLTRLHKDPDGAPRCHIDGCEHPQMFSPVCVTHAVHIADALQEMWTGLRSTYKRHLETGRYDPPKPVEDGTWVYYLMVGPNTVKIGTTKNLPKRISSLRSELQYVVALEPGDSTIERHRHLQFAAERYGAKEDFALSDRLKEHIESLIPQREEHLSRATNMYKPKRGRPPTGIKNYATVTG